MIDGFWLTIDWWLVDGGLPLSWARLHPLPTAVFFWGVVYGCGMCYKRVQASSGSLSYRILSHCSSGFNPAMASTHRGPNLPKKLSTTKEGCGLAKLPWSNRHGHGPLWLPGCCSGPHCFVLGGASCWVSGFIAHVSLGLCRSGSWYGCKLYEALMIPFYAHASNYQK